LEIHNAINSDGKYFVVSIGRQFGKTLLGENQALKWAVENNWKIGWISPTYKQCKKVFKEIVRAMGKNPFITSANHSDLVLNFTTGSTMLFYSAEAYDSIRGETFDALVGDEVAFWKPEAWNEVLKATVLVKGKKVLLLSTPKGKNQFYTLFNQSINNDNYHSFYGTSFDNPFIERSEIEDARRMLPDHIFRQEYLAEFLDDASSVFRNIKECIEFGEETRTLFAGVDLGRADDYTVLAIVDQNNREVYCERWRHLEWSTIINNVVTQLNKYKPNVLIESNGAQDAIYEQIRDKVNYNKSKVKPFVTTSKSKQAIVENLIVAFENKEIGIIGKDWQISELETFTYEYNLKTRQIKYSAPSGLHDDYVMSRAICNEAHKTMKSSGIYHISR
jgi:phage FluMu gp28-like protein